jgi:hypothetical protein
MPAAGRIAAAGCQSRPQTSSDPVLVLRRGQIEKLHQLAILSGTDPIGTKERAMKATLIVTGLALAMAVNLSAPAAAQNIPDAPSYAEQQCGNGGYQVRGYPSYDSCYWAAISYYYQQTGGGGDGGGGGGGGSGGTFIGDIPGYSGERGCASRLCNDG